MRKLQFYDLCGCGMRLKYEPEFFLRGRKMERTLLKTNSKENRQIKAFKIRIKRTSLHNLN